MTLLHPDSDDRADPDVGECAECGSQQFYLGMVCSSADTARICAVRCAACGETVEFEMARPEHFH